MGGQTRRLVDVADTARTGPKGDTENHQTPANTRLTWPLAHRARTASIRTAVNKQRDDS
jgi:hypothetical protein